MFTGKKKAACAAMLSLAMVAPLAAFAENETRVITCGTLNLRAEESASSAILGKYGWGTEVLVKGVNGDWASVDVGGQSGYMYVKYLGSEGTTHSTAYVKTNSRGLNLRAEPNGNILGSYPRGTKVTVLSNNGNWSKVSVDGKTGYMQTQWLSTKSVSSGSSTVKPATGTAVVNNPRDTQVLFLRREASANSESLGYYRNGKTVTLLARQGDWYKVSVDGKTGLNDDLNGVERPVSFDIPDVGANGQVVHSLAKWKRLALKRYEFNVGKGLFTDMNAIRRDEEVDNLHSVYVDQWDWEKVISREDRNVNFLKQTVRAIVGAVVETNDALQIAFPSLHTKLEREVYFVTTQELEDRWPELTPKEREHAICREHHTVFLMQIGDNLKRSGKPHDGRAPDYDDWSLNGDILLYNPVLDSSFEISSMGIRVDEAAMDYQLNARGCNDRRELPFHKMLLNGELPLTIGGGIGQSRLCMIMIGTCHIGEVQASLWDKETEKACADAGIMLL